jgi:hypothetical protein
VGLLLFPQTHHTLLFNLSETLHEPPLRTFVPFPEFEFLSVSSFETFLTSSMVAPHSLLPENISLFKHSLEYVIHIHPPLADYQLSEDRDILLFYLYLWPDPAEVIYHP